VNESEPVSIPRPALKPLQVPPWLIALEIAFAAILLFLLNSQPEMSFPNLEPSFASAQPTTAAGGATENVESPLIDAFSPSAGEPFGPIVDSSVKDASALQQSAITTPLAIALKSAPGESAPVSIPVVD